MRRAAVLVLLSFLVLPVLPASPALAADAAPGRLGVVLLHGKHGAPDRLVTELAAAMRGAGHLVATPEMPWSRRRAYAVDYAAAMREIAAQAAELRGKGATAIVVAGHSLGANAALGFAAGNPGLAGLVCLAPGHSPERGKLRELVAAEVARARELAAAGKAGESVRFTDLNMDRTNEAVLPAGVFLSYFDPEGPAAMPASAARISPALPVLWVVGSSDPLARFGRGYVFDRLPAHPASRYAEVDAGHTGVPTAAIPLVLEWLAALPR